ncbi:MAG: ThiF family adenylyltransferase [bacterium]
MDRYSRQTVLPGVGREGQERIGSGHAAVVGLGALGSSAADLLVRAGVGRLTLIDRDVLELHNLQRQALYTEEDVAERLPKAEAARRHLEAVDPRIGLTVHVADLDARSALGLLDGADVLVDGTDNYETRYLINDVAVKTGRPWAYGGVLGSEGTMAAIRPGRTPCLRCLFPDPPPAGSVATCETAGVWSPTVRVVASLEASAALQFLMGEPPPGGLVHLDPRSGRLVRLEEGEPDPQCPACGRHRYDFLDAEVPGMAVRPCGGGSVHVSPPGGRMGAGEMDLEALARRLSAQVGTVRKNPYLLQFDAEGVRMTVFADGRALIQGTEEPDRARSLYARFVGN